MTQAVINYLEPLSAVESEVHRHRSEYSRSVSPTAPGNDFIAYPAGGAAGDCDAVAGSGDSCGGGDCGGGGGGE